MNYPITKYRLAILTSHPIQYQAPLFRKLAAHPKIDLTVYFCWDFGIREEYDPGFGKKIKWDIPLLEGYKYKFLRNYSPKPNKGFLGHINPGIIRELFENHYDAILVHGYANFTSWLAFLGAWPSSTPIIFRGETVVKPNQSIIKKTLKKIILSTLFYGIKAFLPIGTKSKEFYRYYGVPENRLFMTPYAVDNEFFIKERNKWQARKREIKKDLGIPFDMPVILYISKLIKRKRPFDLLKAFEKLEKEAFLLFVGDGEERKTLGDYVKKRSIKNVLFLGFKNQTELPKYYVIGDIFVLPSSFEPWGLVINEAMCYGLSIIATDKVAATTDLVHHGENGFIYPAGDIEALANCLLKLIQDGELRKNMGKRSFEIISRWSYVEDIKGIMAALDYVRKNRA